MKWERPFEKREPKVEEDNVVKLEQPAVIAFDGLGNPIGTASTTIEADALRRHDAEDKLAA